MPHAPARPRAAVLLALLLSAVLALVGIPAIPALAVGPALSVPSGAVDPTATATVTVSGTGFEVGAAAQGVYVNVGESSMWSPGSTPPSSGFVDSAFVPKASIVDGAFSTTLTIPADTLQEGTDYSVMAFCAHGCSLTDRSLDAETALVVSWPDEGSGEGDGGDEGSGEGSGEGDEEADPALAVTSGAVDPTAAATVTVSGSGFAAATDYDGVYVNVGETAVWSPGSTPDAEDLIDSAFIPAVLITDGAFTATLEIPADTLQEGTAYSVSAFCAHGCSATERGLDAIVSLEVEWPETDPEPDLSGSIEVSPSVDLADGDTVTVSGSFPSMVETSSGDVATGVYLMFCVEPGETPGSSSAGRATGDACESSVQQYLSSVSMYGGYVPATGTVSDGRWTFSVEMDLPASFGEHECADAADGGEQCGVFVRLYHAFSESNTDNPYLYDQFVPVTFAAVDGGGGGGGGGTPTDPGTPASVALSVSPSTVNPTVSNSLTVSGRGYTGAGAANGVYVVVGSSSTWQPGSVPGSSGWIVSAWVPAPALSGGAFTTTLTIPANAMSLGGDYGVGTFAAHGLSVTNRTLDAWAPLTLDTFAVASTGSTGGPAATPPSNSGITIVSGGTTEGGEVTATADGFQPNEDGILVVVYSDPIVLAEDVTADADGVVTWSGRLPSGLTGEHTLTFQGSVDRGVVLDITAADAVGCPVDAAALSWGFKESFRAYIDGSIANGEWTVADGATYETPNFGWTTEEGGFAAEGTLADLAFDGSVRFTGHGGALDTTIANPRIVLEGDTGILFLDVTGTTQEGDEVSAIGIEFAALDVAAAEVIEGESLTLAGIPATLTESGAAAFGTYEAGSELDPVTLVVAVGADCAEPVATTDDGAEVDAEPASASSPLPWVIGGLVVLAVLVAILVAVLLRRRAA